MSYVFREVWRYIDLVVSSYTHSSEQDLRPEVIGLLSTIQVALEALFLRATPAFILLVITTLTQSLQSVPFSRSPQGRRSEECISDMLHRRGL